MTHGTYSTLMVVEAGSVVPWTKPEDIAYDPAKPLPPLGRPFRGRFHGAFADDSVLFFSTGNDPDVLRCLISHRGVERVRQYFYFPNHEFEVVAQARRAATYASGAYSAAPLAGRGRPNLDSDAAAPPRRSRDRDASDVPESTSPAGPSLQASGPCLTVVSVLRTTRSCRASRKGIREVALPCARSLRGEARRRRWPPNSSRRRER